jgi:nucleosome binding factor SPN SPT16 subunit
LLKIFANALLSIKPESIVVVMGQETSENSYKKKEIVYILLLMFFSLTPKQYSDGKEWL